jgi:hypothetical protein
MPRAVVGDQLAFSTAHPHGPEGDRLFIRLLVALSVGGKVEPCLRLPHEMDPYLLAREEGTHQSASHGENLHR